MLPLRSNAKQWSEVHQVLVVGASPFGESVAQALTEFEAPAPQRIRFADSLVTSRNSVQTEPLDFICFVVSMQSKLSLERMRQSLDHILPQERGHFVLGRWAVVVLDSDEEDKFAFTLEELQQLAKEFIIPILYCSSANNGDGDEDALRHTLPHRITTLVRRAARERLIPPLFAHSS